MFVLSSLSLYYLELVDSVVTQLYRQVKLWSSQLWEQFLQLRREAWKIQDFNGVWTRDLAISARRSNPLSYEAIDVGSWSFVGSNGSVRNESMMKWYMKWIIYELRIWNQVKLWSSQLWEQFLQLRREAWKIQDFNGVWTHDLAIPVWRSNQLSYEATELIIYELRIWNQVKLWSSQLWEQFLQLRREAWKIRDFNCISFVMTFLSQMKNYVMWQTKWK